MDNSIVFNGAPVVRHLANRQQIGGFQIVCFSPLSTFVPTRCWGHKIGINEFLTGHGESLFMGHALVLRARSDCSEPGLFSGFVLCFEVPAEGHGGGTRLPFGARNMWRRRLAGIRVNALLTLYLVFASNVDAR